MSGSAQGQGNIPFRVRTATKLAIALAAVTVGYQAQAALVVPGDLVVTTSTYEGTASTVTVGQALPGGGTATANGAGYGVWSNETPDPSFGVTAPIILQSVNTTTGTIDQSTNLTDLTGIVTSFSSKSELAVNLSTDGTSLTLAGYQAPINALDVSNSNTPGITEPGNPVTVNASARAVVQLNANGTTLVSTTNAFPGNNPRAVILSNGQYYAVGNAGNGNGSTAVTAATGVQLVTPGQTIASTPGTTQLGSYSITQNGYTADKTAKDNNFRGETIFNNTLYVSKGSGSNGIDTVYQVGATGGLSSATGAAISVLPGFNTTLAKSATNAYTPFGLWFANASTLYVGDEGGGSAANAGLEKWSLVNGTWTQDYTLQNGLNLGTQYTVNGDPYNPATAGLRNITGVVNADGTVTIYGVTSTTSSLTDPGADPNKLVAITDNLANTSVTGESTEQFTTLETAQAGQVLRGVALDPVSPVPLPPSILLLLSGLGLFGLMGLRARLGSDRLSDRAAKFSAPSPAR